MVSGTLVESHMWLSNSAVPVSNDLEWPWGLVELLSTFLKQYSRRTHNSTATAASLVTRSGTNLVPVVCSGVPLCAWHSTGMLVWEPATDIRDRRSSMSPLCWHHDTTRLVPSTRRATRGDRAFPVAAARAWNSLPLETRACFSQTDRPKPFDTSCTSLEADTAT